MLQQPDERPPRRRSTRKARTCLPKGDRHHRDPPLANITSTTFHSKMILGNIGSLTRTRFVNITSASSQLVGECEVKVCGSRPKLIYKVRIIVALVAVFIFWRPLASLAEPSQCAALDIPTSPDRRYASFPDPRLAFISAALTHAASVNDCAACPTDRYTWRQFVADRLGPAANPSDLTIEQLFSLGVGADPLTAVNAWIDSCVNGRHH